MPFFKIEQREDHLRSFFFEGEEDGRNGVCRYETPLENEFEDYVYLLGWREGWKHNSDRHQNTYFEVGYEHGCHHVNSVNAEQFCPTRADLLAYQLGYIKGQHEADETHGKKQFWQFWIKTKPKKRLTGQT